MYRSEKNFVMKFLAALIELGVYCFPFDNAAFYLGAEYMQRLFHREKDKLGARADELSMLFLKNPMGGVYSEFREGIARQNGSLLSFDNPYYVNARIQLDPAGAAYILESNFLDIDKEIILNFAREFCRGAGINVTGD